MAVISLLLPLLVLPPAAPLLLLVLLAVSGGRLAAARPTSTEAMMCAGTMAVMYMPLPITSQHAASTWRGTCNWHNDQHRDMKLPFTRIGAA